MAENKRTIIGSPRFQKYIDRVVNTRYGRHDINDREDLRQEACLTMLKPTRKIDSPWGYTQYAIRERHRADMRKRCRFGAPIGETSLQCQSNPIAPLDAMVQREDFQRLSVLLSILPDDERRCIVMRVCHDCSFHEIQEALGLKNYQQARRFFKRAFDHLIEIAEEHFDSF